jgi:hypothetical protein
LPSGGCRWQKLFIEFHAIALVRASRPRGMSPSSLVQWPVFFSGVHPTYRPRTVFTIGSEMATAKRAPGRLHALDCFAGHLAFWRILPDGRLSLSSLQKTAISYSVSEIDKEKWPLVIDLPSSNEGRKAVEYFESRLVMETFPLNKEGISGLFQVQVALRRLSFICSVSI